MSIATLHMDTFFPSGFEKALKSFNQDAPLKLFGFFPREQTHGGFMISSFPMQ